MPKADFVQTARVALLIDADNISSVYAEKLVSLAVERGAVVVRKAYVRKGTNSPWTEKNVQFTQLNELKCPFMRKAKMRRISRLS